MFLSSQNLLSLSSVRVSPLFYVISSNKSFPQRQSVTPRLGWYFFRPSLPSVRVRQSIPLDNRPLGRRGVPLLRRFRRRGSSQLKSAQSPVRRFIAEPGGARSLTRAECLWCPGLYQSGSQGSSSSLNGLWVMILRCAILLLSRYYGYSSSCAYFSCSCLVSWSFFLCPSTVSSSVIFCSFYPSQFFLAVQRLFFFFLPSGEIFRKQLAHGDDPFLLLPEVKATFKILTLQGV